MPPTKPPNPTACANSRATTTCLLYTSVYKRHRWQDAAYHCPHCGQQITDNERILAIRRAASVAPHYGWRADLDSPVAGFYLSELLSIFEGSRVPQIAKKYLEAKHEMENGKPEAMIVFWNSSLGLPWEYKGELPEEDELRTRAEAYLSLIHISPILIQSRSVLSA